MNIRVTVDRRTRVLSADLSGDERAELVKHFVHQNTAFFKAKKMGFYTGRMQAEIKTWEERGGFVELPRGGFVTLRSLAEKWGKSISVRDERVLGDPGLTEEWPELRITPRPYQEEIVKAMLARQSGIVRASTGSGKTFASIVAAQRIGLPAIFIVWESGLFDQWVENLDRALGLKGREIGVIQGGTCRLRTVTIAMQQSLAKRAERDPEDEVFRSFGTVVFDEVQRAAANTCRAAVDPFLAKYRFGVSADERRKDRMEGMIHELFGRVLYESNQKELEDVGAVIPVDIYVVPTTFEADWYTPANVEGDDDKDDDYNRLLDELGSDSDRTALAAGIAARCANGGRPCFVMVARREHGLAIDQMVTTVYGAKSGIMFGGDDYAKVYDRTRADLVNGKLNCAVGTIQSIGQGIDVPRVHDVVLASPAANNRQLFNQARGRACRPHGGEKSGRVWYLWDHNVDAFRRHLANLDEWFPGRVYVLPDPNGDRRIPAGEYIAKYVKKRKKSSYGGLFA